MSRTRLPSGREAGRLPEPLDSPRARVSAWPCAASTWARAKLSPRAELAREGAASEVAGRALRAGGRVDVGRLGERPVACMVVCGVGALIWAVTLARELAIQFTPRG